jgi:hypothetical protein
VSFEYDSVNVCLASDRLRAGKNNTIVIYHSQCMNGAESAAFAQKLRKQVMITMSQTPKWTRQSTITKDREQEIVSRVKALAQKGLSFQAYGHYEGISEGSPSFVRRWDSDSPFISCLKALHDRAQGSVDPEQHFRDHPDLNRKAVLQD